MSAPMRFAPLLLAAAIACNPDQRSAVDGAESARGADTAMASMDHGETASRAMMVEMRAHLLAVSGVGSDSLSRMMPGHRQMAANLLQQMDAEMRTMGMTVDTTWRAATDSVRHDLTRLPELTPEELPAFMRGHGERLERIMMLHDSMVGTMH